MAKTLKSFWKAYQSEFFPNMPSCLTKLWPDCLSSARYARSTSVPPTSRGRYAASPFRDRATSTPPLAQSHYSDFDYKVINYMAKLTCQDDIKQYVSSASTIRYRQYSAQQVLTMLQESRGTGSISPGQLQEQVQLLRRHQAHGGLSLPRHQPGHLLNITSPWQDLYWRWWEAGSTTTWAAKRWMRGTREPPVLWSAGSSQGQDLCLLTRLE